MDEEQSKNKINVNSFFERVDSVEKVASSALTKSDSVMNVANANKLLVESLQLTVEAMQTEIRDIANYIIVENKLEKDLKEDRLLEEQDAQQKKDFEDKLLGLKGPAGPQGPQGVKGEDFGSKGGGGSFLGGLLKGLATLGAGAFALKFMWPALLPVIKGAIGSAVSGGVKFLGGAVGKTLIGILGGIPIVGAAAKLIGGGIEKTSNKAGDGLESAIKNMGENGKINIPTSTGEGGTEVKKENLVNGDESMRETLSQKDLMVTPGTRINEEGALGGGEPSSGDLSMFDDEVKNENKEIKDDKKKFKVIEGEQDITIEQLEREIASGEAKIQKMKDEGRNERKIQFEQKQVDIKKQTLKEKKLGLEVDAKTKYRIVEPIKSGTEELDLSTNDIGSDLTKAVALTNERIDNQNGGENLDQNTGNLVSANKPNVTEATLKLASAPLPFVKVIKNNQLSISPKSYNGLPPEIQAMMS